EQPIAPDRLEQRKAVFGSLEIHLQDQQVRSHVLPEKLEGGVCRRDCRDPVASSREDALKGFTRNLGRIDKENVGHDGSAPCGMRGGWERLRPQSVLRTAS